jgi:hypothetical protein
VELNPDRRHRLWVNDRRLERRAVGGTIIESPQFLNNSLRIVVVALQPGRGGGAPNSSATSHSIVIVTATITRFFLVDHRTTDIGR